MAQCLPSSRRVAGAFAALAVSSSWLVATTPSAHASGSGDVGPEPVALRYEAIGACPSEPSFLATVRTYTTRWIHVPLGTPGARTIRVRVSAGPSQSQGRLAVSTEAGAISERDIAGPTCAEVSQALAVMVAVAIDPRAGMADSTKPPMPASGAPVDTNPDSSSGAGTTSSLDSQGSSNEDSHSTVHRETPGDTPAPEALPRTRAATRPAARQVSSAPPAADPSPRISLDLRAEVTSAVVGTALPVIGLSAKLEPSDVARSRWLRTWRPSVGVGLRQSFPLDRELRGGSAEVLWTVGHLRLCPFRLAIATIAEVSPCAEINLGRLHVSPDGFADARSASSFWIDVGGSLWANVNLSQRVFLSSTVLLTEPLSRQPFTLASGTTVARVPPLGVLGGIGLGVRL